MSSFKLRNYYITGLIVGCSMYWPHRDEAWLNLLFRESDGCSCWVPSSIGSDQSCQLPGISVEGHQRFFSYFKNNLSDVKRKVDQKLNFQVKLGAAIYEPR